MIIYRNCIAHKTGINKPHTLEINNNCKISIVYSNNLNQDGINQHLKENGFFLVAIAYDKQNNQYQIFSSSNGILAIKDEYIKSLSVAEMIEKYNLEITEEQYKYYFNID
jgi:hypothetical protein